MIGIVTLLKEKKKSKKEKFTITVLPGFNCNLKCKMCFNWTMPKKNQVSSQEWTRMLESLIKFKYKNKSVEVSIGGGEPLLHDCIFDIIQVSKKLGFRSNISTNGFLLTKSVIEKCVDSGLSGISISLDSLNPKTHDNYRGVKGTYNRVLKAIDYIKKNTEIELSINTVMMAQNLDEIIPLVKWIISFETVAFNIQAVSEPFQKPLEKKWYDNPNNSHLWPADVEKIKETIKSLIKLKRQDIITNKSSQKMMNTVMQLELFETYFLNPSNFIKHKGCSLVDKNAITINPDGSVYLCPYMKSLGNIKSDKLPNIINSITTEKIVKKMKICTRNCHFLLNCYYQEEEVEVV